MSLLNIFFPRPPINVTDNLIGEMKEHPKVAELREKAKANMKAWGRKSLLEGGKFSIHNTVLTNKKVAKKKATRSKV